MIGVFELVLSRWAARLSPFSEARLYQEIALWSGRNLRVSNHGFYEEAQVPTLSYQGMFRFRPLRNSQRRTLP